KSDAADDRLPTVLLRLKSLIREHVIEADRCERRCEIEEPEGHLGLLRLRLGQHALFCKEPTCCKIPIGRLHPHAGDQRRSRILQVLTPLNRTTTFVDALYRIVEILRPELASVLQLLAFCKLGDRIRVDECDIERFRSYARPLLHVGDGARVLCDAGLSDLEAELEQLAMNTRRSPQGIFPAYPPDQRAQFRIDLRSASKRAGFPTPVPTEAGSMPTHERLWPDDRDGLEDRRKPSIQQYQEQAISIRELDATAYPPLQHDHLMSKCCVLCL